MFVESHRYQPEPNKGKVYLNPEYQQLSVNNPHFDVRDVYNVLVYRPESFSDKLNRDFYTALVEDLLAKGDLELQFFEDPTSKDGFKLTHPSYRDSDDIEWITLRGAKKRRDAGEDYHRQLAELIATRDLRRRWKNDPEGTTYLWVYPADESGNSGYKPVTLIYTYTIVGESGVGRKVTGEFYKTPLSIEGAKVLHSQFSGTEISENIDLNLIVSPIHLPDGIIHQDVQATADAISSQGGPFVIEQAWDGNKGLSKEMFIEYEDQIQQSVTFLNEVYKEIFNRQGWKLYQQNVNDLELAYSFARRVVSNFYPGKKVVTADEIIADYQRRLDFEKQNLSTESVKAFEHHLVLRYGNLSEMQVGGYGCPNGQLAALGFSAMEGPTLSMMGNVFFGGFENEFNTWVCEGCGFHNSIDVHAKKLKERCDKCGKSGKCK